MSFSRILRLIFVASSTLFLTLSTSAQTFTHKDYSAGTPSTGALARADLNHDGFPDLVNAGGTNVFILLNNGDGTFAAPVPHSAGAGPVSNVVLVDVNGDTNPDIVASCLDQDGTGRISISLGNGDGTFKAPMILTQSFSNFKGFDIADFNRDGKPDLAIAYVDEQHADQLTIFFGDGSSFSNPKTISGFNHPTQPGENDYFLVSVAAGDYNGDGNPDIAIGETGGGFDVTSGSFGVFYGQGDGTFGSEVFEGGASGLYKIQTVNANNDGIDDLAYFFAGCHTPCTGIDVAYGDRTGLGHGAGGAGLEVGPSDAGAPQAVEFADVNGDGLPDAIVSGFTQTSAALLIELQQSDGTFKTVSTIPTSTSAVDLQAGDFNRDGKWDFVSSNGDSASITEYTNTTSGIGCAYPSSDRTLNVCTPASGATVTSPVLFRAHPRSKTEISGMKIYVDNVSKFVTKDAPLTAKLIITPGTHNITVKAWDATGPFSKSFSLKVSGDSGSCQPASSARAVTICSPNPSDWQPTSVHLTANANGKNVRTTQVYVDGELTFTTQNFAVDTQLSLNEGKRKITVKGWDDQGSFSSTINVWVYGGACKPNVAPGGRGLTVCSPKAGVTYSSSTGVPVQAIAVSPNKITSFTVQWQNSQPQSFPAGWVNETSFTPVGNNTWKFVAMDSQGTMSSTVTVLVANGSCPAPSTRTVAICSPTNGQTASGTFSLSASAGKPTGTFKVLQIYIDGALTYTSDSQFFSIATALPAGSHRITAKGWDSAGPYSTTINVTSTSQ